MAVLMQKSVGVAERRIEVQLLCKGKELIGKKREACKKLGIGNIKLLYNDVPEATTASWLVELKSLVVNCQSICSLLNWRNLLQTFSTKSCSLVFLIKHYLNSSFLKPWYFLDKKHECYGLLWLCRLSMMGVYCFFTLDFISSVSWMFLWCSLWYCWPKNSKGFGVF